MSHVFEPMDLLATSRKRRPSTLDIIGGHIREMESMRMKSEKTLDIVDEDSILSQVISLFVLTVFLASSLNPKQPRLILCPK